MEYDYRAIKISPALNKVFKKLNTAVLREQRSKMRDILEQLMSEALTINVPVELWLAFLLYKIKSCQKRIKVLEMLKSEGSLDFEETDVIEWKILDAIDNLLYFFKRIKNLESLDGILLPQSNSVIGLIDHDCYILMNHATPQEMVALTQSVAWVDEQQMNNMIYGARSVSATLQLYSCIDKWFCNSMLEFWHYFNVVDIDRKEFYEEAFPVNGRYVISTDETPMSITFRNECYDILIEIRVKEFMKRMDKNHRRLFPPIELEALESIYKKDYLDAALEDELTSGGIKLYLCYLQSMIYEMRGVSVSNENMLTLYNPLSKKELKDYAIYYKNQAEIGNEVPEFIRDEIQQLKQEELSPSIKYDKTSNKCKNVAPKKSRHFLMTRTFIYRYNTDSTSSRRLALLYQFLSREYRETKSYIDPEIAPDDFYSLFSGETNNTVITWTGSKQDLYYLIKRMVDRHIIDIPSSTTIWTITQNHFSDRRGNIFLDLRNQHKPKTSAEAIEHLIDILDPAATTPADLTELSKKLSTAFGGK